MKFTAIRKDQRNQMHITMKSVEKFMERIQTDTKNRDVEGLRQHLQQLCPVSLSTGRCTDYP